MNGAPSSLARSTIHFASCQLYDKCLSQKMGTVRPLTHITTDSLCEVEKRKGRERQRDRERQTVDRQGDRETDRGTERQGDRETEKKTERDRETERGGERPG
eukprot:COSAG03_NODE_6904_length_988_cov_1.535433_2_plen_102_part_00